MGANLAEKTRHSRGTLLFNALLSLSATRNTRPTRNETQMLRTNKLTIAGFTAFTLSMPLVAGCDYDDTVPSFDPRDALESAQPVLEAGLDEQEELKIPLEDMPEPPPPKAESAPEEAVSAFSSYAWNWSRWFSEEKPPVTCFTGGVVSGVRCKGRFCDKLSLRCRPGTAGSPGARTWTSYFSEEHQRYRYCPAKHWMTGLACKGRFCDNIAIECTDMNVAGRNCRWEGWFSEEGPALNLTGKRFIRGIECAGKFCDRKRYYTCALR